MFLSYKNKFNLRYGFDKNESYIYVCFNLELLLLLIVELSS